MRTDQTTTRNDERAPLSRRGFLATTAAATAGLALQPGAPAIAASAQDKLRVALVGVGGRGSAHLREILGDTTYVEVATVCDIDEGARRRASERVTSAGGKAPALVADHRKVAEDPSIDAVFSATPCDQHHRIYVDCIEAGKHLYGEKPLGMTVAEVDEIVAAQEKHPDLVVQVGFQRRVNPRVIEGVKLMREDQVLGPVLEARAAYNNAWSPKWGLGGPGEWQSQRARSGDWMIEQAVHAWDMLNWGAGGTPLKAFGLGNREVFTSNDPKRDVTDLYAAILEYPDNLIVQFSHSWISPKDPAYAGTYVRFIGLKGGIDFGDGKIVYTDRSDRPGEVQMIQENAPNDTMLAIRSFIDSVRHHRKPHATVYHGRDATLVGLMVRKAVDERRVVTWDEITKGA